MVRTVTALGIGLVLLGAVLVAGPTFGFSTIAGDRGVSVSTASDDVALLGINVTYDETEFGDRRGSTPETVEVAELENNLDEEITTVDAKVTSVQDNDDDAVQIANVFELDDGIDSDPVAIELECGGIETTDTSDVVITILSAEADSVVISNKPILIEDVSYDCEESDDEETEDGNIEFVELTATVNTDNQDRPESVSFNYEVTEQADIVFSTDLKDTDSLREENTVSGSVTIERGGKAGQQEYPVEVGGDIDGGELCGAQIDEYQAGEPVELC